MPYRYGTVPYVLPYRTVLYIYRSVEAIELHILEKAIVKSHRRISLGVDILHRLLRAEESKELHGHGDV